MRLTQRFDAFLIDLDGVVWLGDQVIEGSADAIAELRALDKRVIFVTNNASKAPKDYAAKLMRMRIPTDPTDIVTSGHAVVEYLNALGLHRGDRIHVCAAPGLDLVLRSAGYTPTVQTHDVRAVVVAWNPHVGFDDLRRAADVARSGVHFISANRDATYPSETGQVPGTGAILAAIETASGRTATVVGKPAPSIIKIALERAGADPSRAMFIGDRPDTDVAGARAAGVPVALVLTGVTTEHDLARLTDQPDVILSRLGDLPTAHEPELRVEGAGALDDWSVASGEPAEDEDQYRAGDEAADMREVGDPSTDLS